MTVCFPLAYVLRNFRCPSRKKGCGQRETLLTPYEMEMVPLMLKELRQINPRFFEIVSFRWFKEVVGPSKGINRDFSKSELPSSSHSNSSATINEFKNEGIALEELVSCVASSLMNNGTFDEQCENRIAAYRRKREQWRCISVIAETLTTLTAPTLLRSRSFSAAMAAPSVTTSRFCGAFCSEGTNGLRTHSLSRGLCSFTTKKRRAMRKIRQTDLLFVKLGEVLIHQFQCNIVGIDKDGSVHERELKLIIWKHFVQILVAVLTDRARFPYKPNQKYF